MSGSTWKYDKDHYRGMALAGGYRWGGFDSESGVHMFARQVLQRWQEVGPGVSELIRDDTNGSWHGLWENLFVTDDDLEDGNAEWMAENGYTRTEPAWTRQSTPWK